jgi:hypothetical protein
MYQKGTMAFPALAGGALLRLSWLSQTWAGRGQQATRVVRPRVYLPEYAANGDLILPKNWRHGVFVGGRPFFPRIHLHGFSSMSRPGMVVSISDVDCVAAIWTHEFRRSPHVLSSI